MSQQKGTVAWHGKTTLWRVMAKGMFSVLHYKGIAVWPVKRVL